MPELFEHNSSSTKVNASKVTEGMHTFYFFLYTILGIGEFDVTNETVYNERTGRNKMLRSI